MSTADEQMIEILEKENEKLAAEIQKTSLMKRRLSSNTSLLYRLKQRVTRDETKKKQKQADKLQDNPEEQEVGRF